MKKDENNSCFSHTQKSNEWSLAVILHVSLTYNPIKETMAKSMLKNVKVLDIFILRH